MIDRDAPARRSLLLGAVGLAGAGVALASCAKGAGDTGLSPTEDLMRGAALIGRILVIYREAAALVRANFSSVDAKPIWRAADLFRRFGQGFHEQVEETIVFPQALKAGGQAAQLIPILIAQHARGREITAYIQARTAGGAISVADSQPLVLALESFARMYEAHCAYADTVVYPAWRAGLSTHDLQQAAKQIADLQKAAFRPGGFPEAVAEAAAIESALRIGDLARYTAEAPGAPAQGVIALPPSVQGGAD